MKKIQEVILKNDTETIKNHTSEITKLSKYDKILLKGNNIFIKFVGQHQTIPIYFTKSFFTICKMSRAIPEEIVLFSLYLIEDTVTESESISVAEKIDKKEKKRIPIVNKFKESILDSLVKKGNFVAKNPDFYNKIWRRLYKTLFVFPIFIILGLIIQLVKFKFVLFALVELINYLLIGLLVFTAILGNMKMEKKNIQDWGIVNLILLVMICISLISLLSCFIPALGGSIFELLNSGKILIIPFYLCLCFIFFTILFLNIEMNKFYEKYHEEEVKGKLLEDIQQ
jgi:hypothetical protein